MTSPGGNLVTIVVKAEDKTAPGFKAAEQGASKLGGTLKRVGEIAAGILAADMLLAGAQKLKAIFSQSVEAASALGESINAVNKTFGESAKQVTDWGEANAAAFGLSTRAFNQMATPLGAMLKNQGLTMDQVADHTLRLTQRAADMASVFNTDVTAALIAIQAGLRGEQDPLERYGVSLSAVAVEARALADSHKTSTAQLTAAEKATARLNLIYEQTESTANDFRDTSDGLANSQRIAAAEIENAKAKIGETFLPVMAKAAQLSGEFASSLASIPSPVLTITAAVVGLLAALLLLAPRIQATKLALAEMAASSNLAERGISRMAGAAVKGTVALIGLHAILEAGQRSIRGNAQFVDDLGHSFDVMGETVTDTARNVDAALAKMAAEGHGAEALEMVSDAAEDAGISIEFAKKHLPQFTAALEGAVEPIDAVAEAADKAADNLGEVIDKYEELIDAAFGAEEAEDRVAESVAELTKQLQEQKKAGDEGAGSLVGNTEAARDNRESVRGLVDDYSKLIQEYQKAGKSTDGLGQQLEDQLVAMGFSRDEAAKYTQQITDMGKALHSIPPVTTAEVVLRITQQETARENRRLTRASGGITGAAGGGPRGNEVLVGEQGPEIVDLAPGSMVHSNPDSMRMLQGGGPREVRHIVDLRINGRTVRELLIEDARGRNVPASTIAEAYP